MTKPNDMSDKQATVAQAIVTRDYTLQFLDNIRAKVVADCRTVIDLSNHAPDHPTIDHIAGRLEKVAEIMRDASENL